MDWLSKYTSLLLIVQYFFHENEAKYGGNDIFTSLEAMRRLWQEEKVFVEKIEVAIKNFNLMLPELER